MVRLGRRDGRPLARVAIDTDPASMKSEHPIIPGPDGSWLTSTPEGPERWALAA